MTDQSDNSTTEHSYGDSIGEGMKNAVAKQSTGLLLDLFKRYTPDKSYINDMLVDPYGREMARFTMANLLAQACSNFADHIPYAKFFESVGHQTIKVSSQEVTEQIIEAVREDFGSLVSLKERIKDFAEQKGIDEAVENGEIDPETVLQFADEVPSEDFFDDEPAEQDEAAPAPAPSVSEG